MIRLYSRIAEIFVPKDQYKIYLKDQIQILKQQEEKVKDQIENIDPRVGITSCEGLKKQLNSQLEFIQQRLISTKKELQELS